MMKYREIEYSVGDTGNAQWRWKIHRELDVDTTTGSLFGHADTKEDAIVTAEGAIDQILDAGSSLVP
jgi:hypothetical protein